MLIKIILKPETNSCKSFSFISAKFNIYLNVLQNLSNFFLKKYWTHTAKWNLLKIKCVKGEEDEVYYSKVNKSFPNKSKDENSNELY